MTTNFMIFVLGVLFILAALMALRQASRGKQGYFGAPRDSEGTKPISEEVLQKTWLGNGFGIRRGRRQHHNELPGASWPSLRAAEAW